EEFRLAGKAPADGGHALLAHRPGHDRRARAGAAQGRRALERGPSDGAPPAAGPPGDGGVPVEAHGALAGAVGERGEPAGGPDEGHLRERWGPRREPGRDHVRPDAGRVTAGYGDRLAQGPPPRG